MNKIFADAVAYGRQYMRSKVGAFFTFIFPILLILLFGAVFAQTGSQTFDLPTQDLDGTVGANSSAEFMVMLNATKAVRITMIPSDVNITEYIREKSLSFALQIPADFQANITAAMNATVTIHGDPSKSTFGTVVGVVNAVKEQKNFALAGARPIVGFTTVTVGGPKFQAIDFFLPGIVGMTVMTNALYAMTSLCAEYRTRRYFKLLATTTLKKWEWLAGKILWFSLSLVISLVVTVAVGIAVWNVHLTLDAISFAFIILGAFLFASLGMVLGSFAKDPESASAIANAIGFPMMFLGGSFWQIEVMPSYLQAVARAMPLTYLNEGLRASMVYQNLGGALMNLAVVAVLGVLFFVLGSRLMSWKQR